MEADEASGATRINQTRVGQSGRFIRTEGTAQVNSPEAGRFNRMQHSDFEPEAYEPHF
jgi:hypothetical protein